jgi:3-methylfumaryl-CoA hydratase
MSELVTQAMRGWIGRSEPPIRFEVTRRDIVKYALATDQRLPKYIAGDEAPPMFLFGADRALTPLSALGPDGLRNDPLMPALPLKRVMAGGVKQRYFRALRPGDVVTIQRSLTDIYAKQGASGPLIFIVYEIRVTDDNGALVLLETQTRINR